jgi:phosphatidate cytidylyltransferase
MSDLGNTTKRVLVSVVAIPLIVAATYLGGLYFFTFALLVGLISFYELAEIARNKNISVNTTIGLTAITLLLANQYQNFFDLYSFLLILVVVLAILELFRKSGSAISNISVTLLGIFYIGFFTSALIGIREFYPAVFGLYFRGGYIIISVLASIWICDSAAFFGGTALGKHKIAPRISPHKSWEGAIFGFCFAIITMVIAKFFVLDFLSWEAIIILGFIIGTIGQMGDLFESLLKRDAGVKDSSGLIPGHGGIFDRFDSLLLTAPVILLYLKYFER